MCFIIKIKISFICLDVIFNRFYSKLSLLFLNFYHEFLRFKKIGKNNVGLDTHRL